jgi:PAS domain S-box-containing protein
MLKSLIAALDSTDRKSAFDELHKNEIRLKEAERIAHFGWWERDFTTNHVSLSDELCRIFGVQPADIPEWHQRWLNLIHPEDRSKVAEAAATALGGGPRYDVEYRIIRPDGAVRIVHSRGDVTWDEAGKPLRQFGVLQDITELRVAEQDLRASEARFRTFVDHATDAFFLLDDQLRVVDVNRKACGSLGYGREELVGMHPRDFDVGLDEASIERLRQRIASEETLTFETRHRRKDGVSFPVEISARQFEPGGRLLCLVRDTTERKRAEDALRSSEERFRTLVQFSFDVYWETDSQHRYTRVEFSSDVAGGPERRELIGKTPWEVPYVEPDEEAWRKHWETMEAHLPFRDFELARFWSNGRYLKDKDIESSHAKDLGGEKRYISISGLPVFDGQGNFAGYRGVAKRISERKRAENALRTSEERFRTLVQFSFDAYWETDAQHRFIRQEFAEGLSDAPAPGSEIGKTRWEVPYLEPGEEAWRKHRETLDAHLPFRDFELARPTPDGGKRYVSVSGMPMFDEKGHFVGYRGVGRHITERKQAEIAIRESEKRFRTLFEKANDAIFLENESDEIIEANERACALLGYSRDELLKMKVSDLQAPEVRDQGEGLIRRELERHGGETFESVDLHRSGRRVVVEVTNTPIFDHGRKLVLSVVRDVTERRRAAEALQQMQEQLAHANRVATMGQLTASIAHEIAQPIGAVYNRANAALNFLNRDPPDLEEVREAISRIGDAAERTREIIGGIRDQVKKSPSQRDMFDLNRAIEEVLLLASTAITKDAIAVQTGFAKDLPPVQGDRVQLQQVALNLILNAVEAMRSTGDPLRDLRISTEANEAGDVLVSVCDTGPGITSDNLERIFEPFFTTKPSGMGIGLSICRSIIEAHGGSLWAGANQPRGTTFQFTLPSIPAGS